MYRLAFLIPHFNHSEHIGELVAALAKFGQEILIVDDGSNESHKAALQNLSAQILYREKNGGKGAAVKSGLKFLAQRGFTHALQIDADMQHKLDNVSEFIALSQKYPYALVCGAPVYSQDAPKSRLYGRKITNFWVRLNTLGGDIKDAMCGFRIYPLETTCKALLKSRANRMDFDIEIFYLLFKAGVKFLWLDVGVKYDKNGVSHFMGLKDNLAISAVHARNFLDLPAFVLKRLTRG